MSNYRRANIAGATYFFTVVTYRRQPILCDAPVHEALREAVMVVREARPFTIDAWVLLPDHLHLDTTVGRQQFSRVGTKDVPTLRLNWFRGWRWHRLNNRRQLVAPISVSVIGGMEYSFHAYDYADANRTYGSDHFSRYTSQILFIDA